MFSGLAKEFMEKLCGQNREKNGPEMVKVSYPKESKNILRSLFENKSTNLYMASLDHKKTEHPGLNKSYLNI
ncbi:hypothetical protein BpHYR1_041595 [Brachionus plicatilis]|uniref:Uncharacterized protein n=1 Tax=Brachionus plicatilis TaxID=10195 RepID=A0A3M7SRU8_BRAPC|nr:hypothetical protein BpHYR1_041595 [Brachionus plicatilis]